MFHVHKGEIQRERDLCIAESNKDEKTQLKSSKSLLRNQTWMLLRVFLIKFQHQKAMNNEDLF